jgi:hypothetical protein
LLYLESEPGSPPNKVELAVKANENAPHWLYTRVGKKSHAHGSEGIRGIGLVLISRPAQALGP